MKLIYLKYFLYGIDNISSPIKMVSKGINFLEFYNYSCDDEYEITNIYTITGEERCDHCKTQKGIYYVYCPDSRYITEFIKCDPCYKKSTWRPAYFTSFKLTNEEGKWINFKPQVVNKDGEKCVFIYGDKDLKEARPFLKKWGYKEINSSKVFEESGKLKSAI